MLHICIKDTFHHRYKIHSQHKIWLLDYWRGSCGFSTFSQKPVGDPQVGARRGEDASSLKPPCPLLWACEPPNRRKITQLDWGWTNDIQPIQTGFKVIFARGNSVLTLLFFYHSCVNLHLKKITMSIALQVAAVCSFTLNTFLLASVAALANCGLCATPKLAWLKHRQNTGKWVSWCTPRPNQRWLTSAAGLTFSPRVALLPVSGCSLLQRTFVYKPESRMEGLHDSFSNLLSWLRVPSCSVDDIITRSHTGVHTESWTRTRVGLVRRSSMRLDASCRRDTNKKTNHHRASTAAAASDVTDSWPPTTNQKVACSMLRSRVTRRNRHWLKSTMCI